jgi:Domain of unknown function (DUF4412)
MCRFRLQTTLSLALLALFAAAASTAAPPQQASVQYSADFKTETADFASSGRVYVVAGRERRETLMEGMTMVTIRQDNPPKVWMLMPADKMYMEMKGGAPPGQSQSTDAADYKTEITAVGSETLEGLQTRKSKVLMTAKDGSKMGGFWWTTEQGIVVKMDVIGVDGEDKMRMKTTLTNIEIKPQAAALFEIPKDYTAMPAMGMGMVMPSMNQGGAEESEGAPDSADAEAAPPEPKKKKGFGLKDAWDMAR